MLMGMTRARPCHAMPELADRRELVRAGYGGHQSRHEIKGDNGGLMVDNGGRDAHTYPSLASFDG